MNVHGERVECPAVTAGAKTWAGGLLQDRENARHVAAAIANDVLRGDVAGRRFHLDADGKAWSVSVYPPPETYGGGLSFKLDRCTGAVSELYFSE